MVRIKTVMALIISAASFSVQAQTFTIVANSAAEVCVPSVVTLGIQTLPPGNWTVFEWKKLDNLCQGMSTSTVTMGPSPYLYLSGTAATGVYQCTAYDGAGGVVNSSNSILVRILPQASSGTLLPRPGASGATGCVSSVELCVKIVYPTYETVIPPITWFRNNSVIPGAVSPNYLATSSGYYKYQLLTSCGTLISDSISVNIGAPLNASITASGPTTFCAGGSVVLSAASGLGYTYQWRRNGINISGATSSAYTVNSLSGNYSCTVAAPGCSALNSNVISVVINSLPVVSFSGLSGSYTTSSPSAVLAGSPTGGTFSGPGISGNMFSPSVAGAGTHTINYSYTNTSGCQATSSQSTTVCSPPASPGSISGSNTVCAGSTGVTFSCPAVPGSTTYNWVVPSGATIVSGQGTTGITVNFGTTFTSGIITVTAGNSCGNSSATTKAVYGIPNPPTGITGQMTAVCAGSTNKVYTVSATPGATAYNWTVTSGMTITSGQGTSQITVNYSTNFSSGTLGVSAGNSCGYSVPISYTIQSKPSVPGTISGPATFCSNQSGVVYSISPVYGATVYQWLVPSGSTIVSGQGTTSIVVNFGTKSGKVQVRAGNACGYSSYRQLNVSKGCRESGDGEMPEGDWEISTYPNPFNERLTLLSSINIEDQASVKIYDITGKEVLACFVTGQENEINLSFLKPGFYYLVLHSSAGMRRLNLSKTK